MAPCIGTPDGDVVHNPTLEGGLLAGHAHHASMAQEHHVVACSEFMHLTAAPPLGPSALSMACNNITDTCQLNGGGKPVQGRVAVVVPHVVESIWPPQSVVKDVLPCGPQPLDAEIEIPFSDVGGKPPGVTPSCFHEFFQGSCTTDRGGGDWSVAGHHPAEQIGVKANHIVGGYVKHEEKMAGPLLNPPFVASEHTACVQPYGSIHLGQVEALCSFTDDPAVGIEVTPLVVVKASTACSVLA